MQHNSNSSSLRSSLRSSQILPLRPPTDVETCIPRAVVNITQEEAPHLSCLDSCFVCGSSGAADVMMFCVDCGEAFHSFCSGAPIGHMDEAAVAGWRCSNCKVCEVRQSFAVKTKPSEERSDELIVLIVLVVARLRYFRCYLILTR